MIRRQSLITLHVRQSTESVSVLLLPDGDPDPSPAPVHCLFVVGKEDIDVITLDGSPAIDDFNGLSVRIAGDLQLRAERQDPGVGRDEMPIIVNDGTTAGGDAAGVCSTAFGAAAIGCHFHPKDSAVPILRRVRGQRELHSHGSGPEINVVHQFRVAVD